MGSEKFAGVAEWSNAMDLSPIPHGRGFEPLRQHIIFLFYFGLFYDLLGNGSAGNGLVMPQAIDDRTYGSDVEDYDDDDK